LNQPWYPHITFPESVETSTAGAAQASRPEADINTHTVTATHRHIRLPFMGAHSRRTSHRFNPKDNQLLALPEEDELGFRKDVKHMEASMQTKRRSTYERIVWEEGVERGLAQGRDEGRQEGRQEGRREGQLEGRLEGRNCAARELLLDLIRVRFGACAPPLRDRIEAIQDEARLRELALAVVTVSSLSEFEGRIIR
jgi:flagellar biosynthesis/type III secretory pathway protein FliH